MKSKCCRTNPRCASCPVLVLAAARRQHAISELAALVADVVAGTPARTLPGCVAAALADLDAARAGASPITAREPALPEARRDPLAA